MFDYVNTTHTITSTIHNNNTTQILIQHNTNTTQYYQQHGLCLYHIIILVIK